jgi:hypothetical protein
MGFSGFLWLVAVDQMGCDDDAKSLFCRLRGTLSLSFRLSHECLPRARDQAHATLEPEPHRFPTGPGAGRASQIRPIEVSHRLLECAAASHQRRKMPVEIARNPNYASKVKRHWRFWMFPLAQLPEITNMRSYI